MKVRATMHGAVSIVNAIATGNGSAMGISLKVVAEVEMSKGKGVRFLTGKNDDRLVNNIIKNTLSASVLEKNQVTISVRSEIPIGFGLKSSSAVSNAVALACSRIAGEKVDDVAVLDAAVRASLDAKVTITGAYDDATACYYGGFVVTDNYARKLVKREEAPDNLYAVIFLPNNIPRGDVRKLGGLADLFMDAYHLAEGGEYWKAMKLNGVLASAALGSTYKPVLAALEQGALAAGISGNGPSIAAIAYEDELEDIRSAFGKFNGKVLASKVNNQKATAEVVVG
ncbi:MAG: shikimate kinase [Nitrososphaera sp.]|uniref:shikimate kinase n=1 Tax=Nitrososphaera sp. TaxID=1971748 RepID=UPI003D6F8557